MTHCVQCGAELPAHSLVCPACKGLVHKIELERLAAEAQQCATLGDTAGAMRAWRAALELLPRGTAQYQAVEAKIEQLRNAKPSGWKQAAGGLGAAGMAAWKFKFVLLAILSKAKFLLFGLGKMSTLLSMLASFGLYWTVYGWKFAGGLVLSIFVHEMGHVWELNRHGIRASAPMFIPFLGARILLREQRLGPKEDARVGLAGPMWGLGAALFCFASWRLTGAGIWPVLAQVGATINLFNLIPVWQLDGSRGMHALSAGQRWVVAATCAVMWLVTGQTMLIPIGAVSAWKAFRPADSEGADGTALKEFVFLLVALSILSLTPAQISGY